MNQFSKVLQLLIVHTQYHRGPWTSDQASEIVNFDQNEEGLHW